MIPRHEDKESRFSRAPTHEKFVRFFCGAHVKKNLNHWKAIHPFLPLLVNVSLQFDLAQLAVKFISIKTFEFTIIFETIARKSHWTSILHVASPIQFLALGILLKSVVYHDYMWVPPIAILLWFVFIIISLNSNDGKEIYCGSINKEISLLMHTHSFSFSSPLFTHFRRKEGENTALLYQVRWSRAERASEKI